MIAWSFGRRASKSSATRGRPPVMSLCLGARGRDTGEHVAGLHLLPGFNRQNGIHGQQIAGITAALQLDRLAVLVLDENSSASGPRHEARRASRSLRGWTMPLSFIGQLAHRGTLRRGPRNQLTPLPRSGSDGYMDPTEPNACRVDRVAIIDQQTCAVADLVTGEFLARLVTIATAMSAPWRRDCRRRP